jgi:hypothetical protein
MGPAVGCAAERSDMLVFPQVRLQASCCRLGLVYVMWEVYPLHPGEVLLACKAVPAHRRGLRAAGREMLQVSAAQR